MPWLLSPTNAIHDLKIGTLWRARAANMYCRAGEMAIFANFTKFTGSFPPFFFCLFNLLRMVRLLHMELLRETPPKSRNRRLNYVLGCQKGVINMLTKNTTQIKAAVVREKGGPFNVETLTLEGPRRDEVLVKIVATGLCHTDMVARDQGDPGAPAI